MSNTPRTDGCLTEILDTYGFVNQGNCPQRWVNHSRELERELNAANERIKRLEEAGDKMVNEGWNEPHLAGLWRQAKEAGNKNR